MHNKFIFLLFGVMTLLLTVNYGCSEATSSREEDSLLNNNPNNTSTCPDSCDVAGATRCGAAGDVETCEASAMGCLEWVPTSTCEAGRLCNDARGAAACLCPERVWEGDFEGDSTADLEGVTRLQGNLTLHGGGADLLDGLTCLDALHGSLSISETDALENVDSLSSLFLLAGDLVLVDNAALQDLNGLSSITSTRRLAIGRNASLRDLDGFSSLTTVFEHLEIIENPSLQSLEGLLSLTRVGGVLSIFDNAALCSEEVTTLIDLLKEQQGADPNVATISGNTGTCP